MASHRRPPAQDLPDIDPEEMMAGSPFAIPPSPGQLRPRPLPKVLAVAMEDGDLVAFLTAIGLIVAVVAALGVSLLPGF